MRKFFVFLLTMGLASLMLACSTPEEKSLRSLQEFYNELELNHENYTIEDWDKAQAEYDAITAGMNLNNYNYLKQ